MVATEVAQPLFTVQVNAFTPTCKFVAVALGLVRSAGAIVPPTAVHVPVSPCAMFTAFALKVNTSPQMVWLVPATERLTEPRLVIVTSSKFNAEGQTPFVTVQRNTLAPNVKPVTVEAGLLELVIEPLPLIKVQAPVPAEGVVALSMPSGAQARASAPALATEGEAKELTVTSELEGVHAPLAIVQRNLFAPTVIPVTVELN